MPKLVVIAAIARNGVIGNQGELPWGRALPRDMARFKTVSLRCGVVLMGRKTADSLPKPLIGRRNLVLSRSQLKGRPGFEHFPDLKQAMRALPADQKVAVIGGSEIYRMCAPYAQRAYLTFVDDEFSGDAMFPHDSYASYERMGAAERFERDDSNAHPMFFVTARNNAVEPLP